MPTDRGRDPNPASDLPEFPHSLAEFALDGTVLSANAAFLALTNYTLDEIRGGPHHLLVPPEERGSAAYEELWADLRRGVFMVREVRRITKDGRTVWLRASYHPQLNRQGRAVKILELASDITAQVGSRGR